MPELTQLLRTKSMMRYLPPKITAGLARSSERILNRSPCPPARISARILFTERPLSGFADRRPYQRRSLSLGNRLELHPAGERVENRHLISHKACHEEILSHVLAAGCTHSGGDVRMLE